MTLVLAHITHHRTVDELREVANYQEAFAMRRDWRDVTNLLPRPEVGWSYDGATFTPEPKGIDLGALASRYGAALREDAARAIVSGFPSSALGSPRNYPSGETDQRNLADTASAALSFSASAGWTAPLWCETGTVWSFADHTAAMVHQVMVDWVAFRTAQQQTLVTLLATLDAATTLEALQAVVWPGQTSSVG